jgi:Zn-dependent M28 family amino/carboxypeptidase
MWRPLAIAVALAVVVAGCGEEDAPVPAPGRFEADRAFSDLRAQVELGPRPSGSAANRRLVQFLAAELRDAGVRGVRVQSPYANVIGTVPGTEDDAILLAAHHDTKDIPGFVGANDGASGVAVVLELARALPARVAGPSVHFALFDAEEARGDRPFTVDGARGSRQYVAYANRSRPGRRVQVTPPLAEIQTMILFDLVGDCDLQIPREANSDTELYRYIALQAGDDSPFGGTTEAISDDHVPFLEAGVRAVNLIDFTFGPGPRPGEWWHTTEDTLDKACPESLDAVGEAVLSVLPGGPGSVSELRG